MSDLIARFGRIAILILVGLFVILCIGFGIVYFQQTNSQKELRNEIDQISLVVSKSIPNIESLGAEYENTNKALAPLDTETILQTIVSLAEDCGIDTSPESSMFTISPIVASFPQQVGNGQYQVTRVSGIRAQGEYASVISFVSAIDAGKLGSNTVLKSVDIGYVERNPSGGRVTKGEIVIIDTVATVNLEFYARVVTTK